VPTAEGHQLAQIIEIPDGVSLPIGECGSVSELTAYVIEGTLHASVAGSNETLEPGDSLVITTDQPMVWRAEQSQCRVLVVFARPSPGQRAA